MIPTAGEWREIAQLLEPGSFYSHRVDGFDTMPAEAAADVMAAFHLESMERRWKEMQGNQAWNWMRAHHGYKAFWSSVHKKLDRMAQNASGNSNPVDSRTWYAARYMRQVEERRDMARLSAHFDPLSIRLDRAIANAMKTALSFDAWKLKHKALSRALKHVEKAREALASMLVSNEKAELGELALRQDAVAVRADLEHISEIMAQTSSRAERAISPVINRLEREVERLKHEIAHAEVLKTRNGQIREFLFSICYDLRVSNCGTTTGLRRLVEMLDPESSVSDDTIGRILTEARKREAKRDAALDAWIAKTEAKRVLRDAPQSSGEN